jgi:hypothetical protein
MGARTETLLEGHAVPKVIAMVLESNGYGIRVTVMVLESKGYGVRN